MRLVGKALLYTLWMVKYYDFMLPIRRHWDSPPLHSKLTATIRQRYVIPKCSQDHGRFGGGEACTLPLGAQTGCSHGHPCGSIPLCTRNLQQGNRKIVCLGNITSRYAFYDLHIMHMSGRYSGNSFLKCIPSGVQIFLGGPVDFYLQSGRAQWNIT